jgi:hypothetical protein
MWNESIDPAKKGGRNSVFAAGKTEIQAPGGSMAGRFLNFEPLETEGISDGLEIERFQEILEF